MFPQKPFRKKLSGAFTLIEIMVVIAIIAVLMILILGAANNVKESSKATACVSNLRALGVGFAAYNSEHDGAYPPYAKGQAWPHTISKYVDRKYFFCPVALDWEATTRRDSAQVHNDKMWAALATFVSYGYNYGGLAPDVGYTWNPPNPDPRAIKATNIPRSVVLLVDAGQLDKERKKGSGFYVAGPEKGNYSMPLPRHFKKANFLWTDGRIDQRFCDLTPSDKEPYKYTSQADWEPRDEKLPASARP